MKKLLTLLLLAGLALPGCKKDSPTVTFPKEEPKPEVDSNAMQYAITGLTDVSLGWKDSKILPLGFAYTKGNQEAITLSITGLPDGVTGEFDVVKGTPTFTSLLTLKSDVMKDGNYPLQIVAKTDKDSIKKFNFNLKVQTADCRDYAAGKMTCISPCHTASRIVTIEKGDVNAWIVNMENMAVKDGSGNIKIMEPLPFKVDCDSKTLELPYWSYNDNKGGMHLLSGTGSYNEQTISLTINFHSPTTGDILNTCEYQLSK
jgi:hypothetical protein